MSAVDPFHFKEVHYEAISCLAGAMTQQATADSVRVSRATISRWLKHPDFAAELKAEIARRAERAKQAHQTSADQLLDSEIQEWTQTFREYREALIASYKLRIDLGDRILQKAGRRFADLPEESIQMKDIPALLAAGDRMVSQGLELWGDAIAVKELIEELVKRETSY